MVLWVCVRLPVIVITSAIVFGAVKTSPRWPAIFNLILTTGISIPVIVFFEWLIKRGW